METLNSLAGSLLAQSRLQEGARVLGRALRLEEKHLGASDPRFATDLSVYAGVLRQAKREEEAKRVEERARALSFSNSLRE
jgi:hypothetical protein